MPAARRSGGAAHRFAHLAQGGELALGRRVGRLQIVADAQRPPGRLAHLLDLDPRKVNREMVDLEPLTDGDAETLREMLVEHVAETGSPVAEALLVDWPAAVGRDRPTQG